MKGHNYKKGLNEYTSQATVARGCYKFIIQDAFEDGVCCSWGYGYYDLVYDGDIAVYDGGNFRGNEFTENFGDCGK